MEAYVPWNFGKSPHDVGQLANLLRDLPYLSGYQRNMLVHNIKHNTKSSISDKKKALKLVDELYELSVQEIDFRKRDYGNYKKLILFRRSVLSMIHSTNNYTDLIKSLNKRPTECALEFLPVDILNMILMYLSSDQIFYLADMFPNLMSRYMNNGDDIFWKMKFNALTNQNAEIVKQSLMDRVYIFECLRTKPSKNMIKDLARIGAIEMSVNLLVSDLDEISLKDLSNKANSLIKGMAIYGNLDKLKIMINTITNQFNDCVVSFSPIIRIAVKYKYMDIFDYFVNLKPENIKIGVECATINDNIDYLDHLYRTQPYLSEIGILSSILLEPYVISTNVKIIQWYIDHGANKLKIFNGYVKANYLKCSNECLNVLQYLITNCNDVQYDYNRALKKSIKYGQTDLFDLLIDITNIDESYLLLAVGNLAFIEKIYSRIDGRISRSILNQCLEISLLNFSHHIAKFFIQKGANYINPNIINLKVVDRELGLLLQTISNINLRPLTNGNYQCEIINRYPSIIIPLKCDIDTTKGKYEIDINITNSKGKHILLKVKPSDTIDSIKNTYAILENKPKFQIRLVYRGKPLIDDQLLSTYNIDPEFNIYAKINGV